MRLNRNGSILRTDMPGAMEALRASTTMSSIFENENVCRSRRKLVKNVRFFLQTTPGLSEACPENHTGQKLLPAVADPNFIVHQHYSSWKIKKTLSLVLKMN